MRGARRAGRLRAGSGNGGRCHLSRYRHRRRRRQANPDNRGARRTGGRRGPHAADREANRRCVARAAGADRRKPRTRLRRRDRYRVPLYVHRDGRHREPRGTAHGCRSSRRHLHDAWGARCCAHALRRHRLGTAPGQGQARAAVGLCRRCRDLEPGSRDAKRSTVHRASTGADRAPGPPPGRGRR